MDIVAIVQRCLLLFLFFPLQYTAAQVAIDWIPLNDGLEGDQVDLLWQSPAGTFFAGGKYSGLFRSEGYQAPWEMTSLHKVHARKITADAQGTIYVAGYEGLFESDDEGLTWRSTNLSDPVYALAAIPNGDVFAGTYNGLYRRQPGDSDFSLLRQWRIDRHVAGGHREEIEPISLMTVLDNGMVAVAVASNLYLSEDGDTWNCLSVDEGATCWERRYHNSTGGTHTSQITSLDSYGNNLLMGDYGGLMTYCPASAYDYEQQKVVASIPVLGNGFIDSAESRAGYYQVMELCGIQGVGGGIHLFKRSKENTEAAWETIHEEAFSVAVDEDENWLCIGKNNGVHCSEDGGATWEPWNEGLHNAEVYAVFVSQNNLLFAGTMHGMYQDMNAEEDWKPVILNQTHGTFGRGCISSPFAFTQTAEPRFLAVGGGTYSARTPSDMWEPRGITSANTIFTERPETFDFPFCGVTFNYWVRESNYDACRVLPRSLFREDSQYIYTNTSRSSDGFTTKETINRPGTTGLFTSPGSYLYAYQENKLWQSQDHGDTWVEIPFPNVPVDILDFSAIGDSTFIAGTSAGIYVSQDSGMNWEDPIAADQCVNLVQANEHGVIIGSDKLMSIDQGQSWQPIETQLPGYVNALVFDKNGVAYAGTEGWGVFKSAQPLHSTVREPGLTIPFTAQIFPNPAQDDFKVMIELPELAEVHIDLYDMLGRHLNHLTWGPLSRGTHYLPFSRVGIASGMYTVRISAGGQVSYEQVILR